MTTYVTKYKGYPIRDAEAREQLNSQSEQLNNIANELGRDEQGNFTSLQTVAQTIIGAINELKNSQSSGGLDLSSLTVTTETVSEGTKLVLTNGTTTKEVTIPSATETQINTVIQGLIDDGTLSSIALGENSVATANLQDGAITPNKTNFFKEEIINLALGTTWSNTGYSGTTQTIFGSNFWITDYLSVINNIIYLLSPKMANTYNTTNYHAKVACFDADKNYLGMATLNSNSSINNTSSGNGHRWFEEYTLLENTLYVMIGYGNSHFLGGSSTEENRNLLIVSYYTIEETQAVDKKIFSISEEYLPYIINAILGNKIITSSMLSDTAIKEQFEKNSNNNSIIDYINTKFFKEVEGTENLFDGQLTFITDTNPIDSTVNDDTYGYQHFITNLIDVGSNNALCVGLYSTVNTSSTGNLNALANVFCFDENEKYIGKATIEKIDFKDNDKNTSDSFVSRYVRFRVKDFLEKTKYIKLGFNHTWVNEQDILDSCIIRKTVPDFYEDSKLITLELAKNYKLTGLGGNDINPNLPLSGKKVVWIGDSLTNWGGGDGTIGGTGFLDIIATNEGIDAYNQGKAGASWEYGLGTWDDTHTTYTPAEGETEYTAIGRVNTLVSNKDTFVPDYVIFMMGSNRRADGDTTDEYTNLYTMCGAIKHCLLQIYNNFPNCVIGVVLPPQRHEGMEGQESANEKIKTIANYYSVPCLDLFHEGGLLNHERNPFVDTANSGGFSDGLHLSELGMAKIGRKAGHWLRTL